jgi:hypothetical protein
MIPNNFPEGKETGKNIGVLRVDEIMLVKWQKPQA